MTASAKSEAMVEANNEKKYRMTIYIHLFLAPLARWLFSTALCSSALSETALTMAFISVFVLLSWGFIDTKAFTIDLSVYYAHFFFCYSFSAC